MDNIDNQKFLLACNKVNTAKEKNGIGTLGEKTLHAVLKHYYEPSELNHEIKIGSFVADIVNESGIIEIQTTAFNKLRNKLKLFLEVAVVTLVYPIPKNKWLLWIDTKTGETTQKRKSPKQGRAYEVFRELYKIKPLLTNPNLKLCIVLIDIEEYRYLNGWSEDKKQGSTRSNRIPVNIAEEIYIDNINDYAKLIPKELPQKFTSKDYKTHSKLNLSNSQTALNVLSHVNAVTRIGKQGNLFIYARQSISYNT